MNKLIFVSDSLTDLQQVKMFSQHYNYQLEHYSHLDWKNNHRVRRNSQNKKFEKPVSSIVHFPLAKNTAFNSMEDIKSQAIQQALFVCRGNASRAAEMLKIGRATLYRKIKQFHLDLDSIRDQDENSKLSVKKSVA